MSEYENEDDATEPAEQRQCLAALKKHANKKNMEGLWRKYLAKVDGADGDLFTAIMKFAEHEVYGRMRESADADINYKDVAQDVTISIWQQLDRGFVPDDFYPWMHRACFANGSRAAGEVKTKHDAKVPLQVESDDNPDELRDNPLLRRRGRLTYGRALPEFIQGHDKLICDYIRDGLTYKQIAVILVTTETAVKKRVAGMRKQVEASKQSMRANT